MRHLDKAYQIPPLPYEDKSPFTFTHTMDVSRDLRNIYAHRPTQLRRHLRDDIPPYLPGLTESSSLDCLVYLIRYISSAKAKIPSPCDEELTNLILAYAWQDFERPGWTIPLHWLDMKRAVMYNTTGLEIDPFIDLVENDTMLATFWSRTEHMLWWRRLSMDPSDESWQPRAVDMEGISGARECLLKYSCINSNSVSLQSFINTRCSPRKVASGKMEWDIPQATDIVRILYHPNMSNPLRLERLRRFELPLCREEITKGARVMVEEHPIPYVLVTAVRLRKRKYERDHIQTFNARGYYVEPPTAHAGFMLKWNIEEATGHSYMLFYMRMKNGSIGGNAPLFLDAFTLPQCKASTPGAGPTKIVGPVKASDPRFKPNHSQHQVQEILSRIDGKKPNRPPRSASGTARPPHNSTAPSTLFSKRTSVSSALSSNSTGRPKAAPGLPLVPQISGGYWDKARDCDIFDGKKLGEEGRIMTLDVAEAIKDIVPDRMIYRVGSGGGKATLCPLGLTDPAAWVEIRNRVDAIQNQKINTTTYPDRAARQANRDRRNCAASGSSQPEENSPVAAPEPKTLPPSVTQAPSSSGSPTPLSRGLPQRGSWYKANANAKLPASLPQRLATGNSISSHRHSSSGSRRRSRSPPIYRQSSR